MAQRSEGYLDCGIHPRAVLRMGSSCAGGFYNGAVEKGRMSLSPFLLHSQKAPLQCVNSHVTRPTAKERPVHTGKSMSGEASGRAGVKAPGVSEQIALDPINQLCASG